MGLNIETLPNPMHHHARHAQVFGERSHGPLRRVRWPGFEFFSTSGVGVWRGQVQSSPDATVTDRTVFPRSYQTIFQLLSQIRFPTGQPTVGTEHVTAG